MTDQYGAPRDPLIPREKKLKDAQLRAAINQQLVESGEKEK